MEEIRRSGKGGGLLPLHDDDIPDAFGAKKQQPAESKPQQRRGVSYLLLFVTIVVAAPVAALLVLAVIDLYEPLSVKLGLKNEPAMVAPVASAINSDEDERLAMWVELTKKNNKALVNSINKQTKAILKLAKKKPARIKVPPAKVEVIVVKVPTRESFSLEYEKKKLLDLAGVDLDDPVVESSFDTVVSKQVLKEIIRSLDSIIKASRNNSAISSFQKSNALKAKKYAKKRLSKI
ncbi:hypothetical protein MNBD_NITROSPINAE02-391 [hydrothermal vent metagenome]|uniref:Uncharacterized protein n=1 Tax=hydrothermal vent metagenome TaxID=652676 RepID=A0A3B1BNE4_9ZZZZ